MDRNVGSADRGARIALGLAILSLVFTTGTAWGLLGLIPLATGLFGFCPAYRLFGLSTCAPRVAGRRT
jgi:hypothetical protein